MHVWPFFFFFQAEDGIRDWSVTGVQTCALPISQLEENRHGVDVVGMFFFDDNTYVLRTGDPIGERLSNVAKEKGILLMMCDQCAIERGLATGEPGNCSVTGVVEGVTVGCFPDLYGALGGNPP